MRSVLLLPLVLLLPWSCKDAPENVDPETGRARTSPLAPLDTAQAYVAAIAEYIQWSTRRDSTMPDTLYIGRHPDFPAIELPATIKHTTIRIIDPAAVGALQDAPDFLYLNIFSWVDGRVAEFQIVTFKQGMRHRPDGSDDMHRSYVIRSSGELVLDSTKS